MNEKSEEKRYWDTGETSYLNLDNWCIQKWRTDREEQKERTIEQAFNPTTLDHLVSFYNLQGSYWQPILLTPPPPNPQWRSLECCSPQDNPNNNICIYVFILLWRRSNPGRQFSRHYNNGGVGEEERKKNMDKVVGFSSASTFLAMKQEAITRMETEGQQTTLCRE